MPGRYLVPSDAISLQSGRGSADTWLVTPTLLLTDCRGYLDVKTGKDLHETWTKLAKGVTGLHLFIDALDVDGYEPNHRTHTTSWIVENRSRITRVHVLQRSKLVEMGVALASLFTGGLVKGYPDAASFTAEIAANGGARALSRRSA